MTPLQPQRKRKCHHSSNALLKEAFLECAGHQTAVDRATLWQRLYHCGTSNHNTLRIRYFTLMGVILKSVR